MQNVPKIVTERLKAANIDLPSAEHPGADILTAFAERSLPSRERDGVLEHLARCGDCREIVALALPATETVEIVVRSTERGWLKWPVLRWGLAAAGVVAITSLGIVQYQQSSRSRDIAAKSATPVEVAANSPKQEVLEAPAPAAPGVQSDKVQSPLARSAESASSFDEKGSSFGGEKKLVSRPGPPSTSRLEPQTANGNALQAAEPLPHGPKVANAWQQQANAQNQAPAAPPPLSKQQSADNLSGKMQIPSSSQVVEVESAAAQPETQNNNLDAKSIQDLPVARQPATEAYALARVGKAKPALTAPANDNSPSTAPAPAASGAASGMGGADIASTVLAPRWSITSTGALQRSYDRGATWQIVDVNANAATLNAAGRQVAALATPTDSKDTSQALKRDTAAPRFRAVAVNGADVWAGGSGGILFHSLDAGDHWTRVLPASTGASLTGDIVSLEFVDTLHGKVSTSTPETWITSDAGQTWQKQ